MSRKARHQHLLDKSKEAVLAAISCYNQPNFAYREESFCILIMNAWELLFKAKILKDNKEKLTSIYIEDKNARKKNGKPFSNPKYTKNKAGSYETIGFKKIINSDKIEIEKNLKKQLDVLYEYRSSSLHFMKNPLLNKTLLECFTATLRSYQIVCKAWFQKTPLDHLFLIPVAFNVPEKFKTAVSNSDTERLLKFIAKQEENLEKSEHDIRLNIGLKFDRSKTGIPISTSDSHGVTIHVEFEKKFQNKYPYNYTDDLYLS